MRLNPRVHHQMIRFWAAICIAAFTLLGMPAHAGPKGHHKKEDSGEISLSFHMAKRGKALTKKQRKHLRKIATHLKAHPELGKITIVGHTDDRGKPEMNQKLSLKRAKNVKRLLVKFGVKADRLLTEGKGAASPKSPNTTKLARRQNQRIELIPEKATQPPAEAIAAAPEPAEQVQVAQAPPIAEDTPAPAAPVVVPEVATPAPPAEAIAAAPQAAPAQTEPIEKPEPAAAKAEPEPVVEPEPAPAAPVIKPIEVVDQPMHISGSVWLAAGATLASTTAAVVLGAAASTKASKLDTLFIGTDDYETTRDSSSQLALISDISYALGAIGLATTLWFLFDDDSDEDSAQVGAMVTPDGASVFFQMPLGGNQ